MAARAFSLAPDELAAARAAIAAPSDPGARVAAAIAWLAVETSRRYAPEGQSTFCNVYAHDVCLILGVYLPRVWWLPAAFERPSFDIVQVGTSAAELTANGLFTWLAAFGPGFGWVRHTSSAEARLAADAGRVALACAFDERMDGHGHMSILLADDNPPDDALLLQSQAGKENDAAARIGRWWEPFPLHAFWSVAMHREDPVRSARGIVRNPLTPTSRSPQFVRALIAAYDPAYFHRSAGVIERRLVRAIGGADSTALSGHLSQYEIADAYLSAASYGRGIVGLEAVCDHTGIDVTACSSDEACYVIAALDVSFPQGARDENAAARQLRCQQIHANLGPVWASR